MTTKLRFPALALTVACAACSASVDVPTTAFTGATVWDGSGAAAITDATILVQEGRIVSVEPDGDVPRGATEVDLSGTFVTPGLINAHGHVNGRWAAEGVEGDENRIRGDLELFAKYGVTMINSLGDGDAAIAVRQAATGQETHARLQVAGPVIAEYEAESARSVAEAIAAQNVDWLKLRVDDNLGVGQKMPWEAVQAVMDVSAESGIPLATHLFYLDDAKQLLEMGTGMVAHSVRNTDVDDDFISALDASGVCYVPTLTREVSTFTYVERPDFFDDDFFQRHAPAGEVERVSSADFMEGQATSMAARAYRVALSQAIENLRILNDAGAKIAMGTDAGPPARFPGYFEHMELWMMADAGMTPEEILLSATSVAADCVGADDIGTLEAGKWADFIVFENNPLTDISQTRSLRTVYVAGSEVQ